MRRMLYIVAAVGMLAGWIGTAPASASTPACTITGTAGDDILKGTGGRDVICGLAGNDQLFGWGGNDLLIGGPGDDQLYGGRGNDELRGDDGFDFFKGQEGSDLMIGGADGDTFQASTGAAQDGTDVMIGGAGDDTADYSFRTTGVKLYLDGLANDGGPGEHDSIGVLDPATGLTDVESVNGSRASDILVGNDGPNFLVSRGGADVIAARGGDDVIDTWDHAGDDRIYASTGNDYCAIDPGDFRRSCETIPQLP